MADPFYNQIIDRLSKHLDPLVFEACVMDILREVYPGLVPIPGGGDSGRDGLIADESDQPFPLVATTSLDVIGNVRNNLESYLAAGGPRRVVVVATSQSLTPTRRDRIVGAAHDQGFTVKQIHAQDDLANRLYHSPRWCRELLGLAGQPPALSRLPAQNRRWLDLGLIGRDAELKSLVDSKADQIVVGQPGTGKSYLLHHFALTGLGLFVISRDLDRVIDGIRSQDPPSLILDDAGNKLELLEELVHFRREIEGSFRIIASCWPGQEAEISRRLTDPMTIEVGLFNRDELLYLLTERMHIRASVEVVTALITQAAGRPGIAVVLGQMWEGGHWEKALSGDLLMEEVLRFTSDTTHVKGVLACFALGGEVGMILDVVSKIYQLRPLEIQEILTRLSVGGIIEVESNNLVKVRIEPLRYALVKDVFFGKNPVSSALRDQLIAEAPNKSECIRTLIGARARGGMVPDQLIRTEIEQLSYFSRGRILALYAQLGREEAIWAWEMDNTLAFEHAAPFLNFIPDILLPHLFDSCLEDQRPTALHPDTPMSQIQKWVSGLETPAEFIRRRQLLMDRAFRWGEQVDHQQVLERLFCIVLSPRLEWYKPHPGEGYKLMVGTQVIDLEVADFLKTRWPDMHDLWKKFTQIDWISFSKMISEWLYPWVGKKPPTEEWRGKARLFCAIMIRDMIPLMASHPGVLGWAFQLNTRFELGLPIDVDEDFEVIYPALKKWDWKASAQASLERIPEIAQRWQKTGPEQIRRRLTLYEDEYRLNLIHRLNLQSSFVQVLEQQSKG